MATSRPDPTSELLTRPPWWAFISRRKALLPLCVAKLKSRSAIKPVTGHMKVNHRIIKYHLKGILGDRVNLKMAAVSFNFQPILKWLMVWLCD